VSDLDVTNDLAPLDLEAIALAIAVARDRGSGPIGVAALPALEPRAPATGASSLWRELALALAFRDGVSFFYGALDRETAMAEVRPWRKARISVARFTTTSTLTLADLTGRFAGSESTDRTKWLGFIVGRPVHRDDTESYLPTQRVAEVCRAAGLKGILYDSSLKPDGVNVALFAGTGLECQEVELHEVTGVSYTTVRLSPLSGC